MVSQLLGLPPSLRRLLLSRLGGQAGQAGNSHAHARRQPTRHSHMLWRQGSQRACVISSPQSQAPDAHSPPLALSFSFKSCSNAHLTVLLIKQASFLYAENVQCLCAY